MIFQLTYFVISIFATLLFIYLRKVYERNCDENKYIFLRKTKENRQESMNHEADKNMHFDHSG